MRIAYLDCFAGISGDMFLGALVGAGVPRSVLERAADAMHLGASLRFETVDRSGISATKVHVLDEGRLAEAVDQPVPPAQQKAQAPAQHQHGSGPSHSHMRDEFVEMPASESEHVHGRSLTAIRELIHASALADDVKALSVRTFEFLGQSEAKIHNVPVDEIYFHEVGAVDAIVDIVATCAGIVHLEIAQWYCSPVNVGGGTVRCAHGLFPVPAPATADLLRGAPTYSAHVQKELVTPTGAALLRTLAPIFGPQPSMRAQQIGYGAGTRNPPDFPNVLRLSLGDSDAVSAVSKAPQLNSTEDHLSLGSPHTVAVLEAALDDASPQLLGYVSELALKLGALDVMLTPVVMKKGRPGTLFTVLARPEEVSTFQQVLLRETTTLGLRIRYDRRVCLEREHVPVATEYGTVRVKIGGMEGEVLNAAPEFEDCRRAAEEHGVPLKHVHAAAVAAYLNQTTEERKR